MADTIQVVRKEDYDEVLAYAPEYFVEKWNLDKPDVIELTEERRANTYEEAMELDPPAPHIRRRLLSEWEATE